MRSRESDLHPVFSALGLCGGPLPDASRCFSTLPDSSRFFPAKNLTVPGCPSLFVPEFLQRQLRVLSQPLVNPFRARATERERGSGLFRSAQPAHRHPQNPGHLLSRVQPELLAPQRGRTGFRPVCFSGFQGSCSQLFSVVRRGCEHLRQTNRRDLRARLPSLAWKGSYQRRYKPFPGSR